MSQEFTCSIETLDAAGTLVRVSGDVDLQTSPTLRDKLLSLLETTAAKRLVIELSSVAYMDSSGVGTLVDLKRRVEKVGGKVLLVGMQARVRNVFEITRLDRFFVILNSLDEARKA